MGISALQLLGLNDVFVLANLWILAISCVY
jgi:hypothetical protein